MCRALYLKDALNLIVARARTELPLRGTYSLTYASFLGYPDRELATGTKEDLTSARKEAKVDGHCVENEDGWHSRSRILRGKYRRSFSDRSWQSNFEW